MSRAGISMGKIYIHVMQIYNLNLHFDGSSNPQPLGPSQGSHHGGNELMPNPSKTGQG